MLIRVMSKRRLPTLIIKSLIIHEENLNEINI